MKILDLQQGSDEWLAARASHFTASEAPAMMGDSKHMTRTQLLDLKATGVIPGVDDFTQKIFDKGHAAEASARPLAENIVGEELFPATVSADIDGLPLLASCDGLTMLGDVLWEHKLFNQQLAEDIKNNTISDHYKWQMDQQLLVTGAKKCLFMCSDGTQENMEYTWYEISDDRRVSAILSGWAQFAADLANHTQSTPEETPETKAITELPALSISITGGVTASNLATYKSFAIEYIDAINTELSTDEDFANAEQNVKFCKKAETELATVKKQALSQTADIDQLFRDIDHISESLRSKRLALEKLVKAQKLQIKRQIVMDAKRDLDEHIKTVEVTLMGWTIPPVASDFAGAIKNKRTLSSLHDAADTHLAHCKAEASNIAMTMAENRRIYNELSAGHEFLFSDIAGIAQNKTPDDFKRLIEGRLREHQEAEQRRLEAERQRIRQEEEARAKHKAKQEQAAREENERKAQEQIERERQKAEKAEKAEIIPPHETVTQETPEKEERPVLFADSPELASHLRRIKRSLRAADAYYLEEAAVSIERMWAELCLISEHREAG